MADLNKALAQIQAIRGQVARGSEFRGYGAETVAATGVLAMVAAVLQTVAVKNPAANMLGYLALWVSTAAVAVLVTGFQTITRTRRVHSGLARQMIFSAAESLFTVRTSTPSFTPKNSASCDS